jgi:hypothetical protein
VRTGFAASLLLGQWILLLAFSSSERLHHAVCDGARQPSHDCVLTAVAKGQFSAPVETVSAPVAEPVLIFLLLPEPVPAGSFRDLRLSPGRAPPVRLSPA